jgi:hypothetical protein
MMNIKVYIEVVLFPPGQQGAFCACGLSLGFAPGGGFDVDNARVLLRNEITGELRPLPDDPFGNLAPNPNTTDALNQRFGGTWFGFQGFVPPFNPGNFFPDIVVLCFEIDVPIPVIPRIKPANVLFAAGEANPDGTLPPPGGAHDVQVFTAQDPTLGGLPELPPIFGQCPGDLTGDCKRDLADLAEFAKLFLEPCIKVPQAPVITDVQLDPPGTGPIVPGDILRIQGSGFDPDPDNMCTAIRGRNPQTGAEIAAPVRVIGFDGPDLLARVGQIPDDFVGIPCAFLGMQVGNGNVGIPQLRFPDVEVVEPVWVWEGQNQAGVEVDLDNFGLNLDPGPPPPPGVQWFKGTLEPAGVLPDGTPVPQHLEVKLFGDWCPGAEIRVTVRAHDKCKQLDLEGPKIRTINGGSLQQCAEVIKDLLICAFLDQTGQSVCVACCWDPAQNCMVIKVWLANLKDIQWGLLNICVSCPPPVNILGVQMPNPPFLNADDVVCIRLEGAGDLGPKNFCVATAGGMLLEAQQINPDPLGNPDVRELKARVLEFDPQQVGIGPMMVARGKGFCFPPANGIGHDIWVWCKNQNEPGNMDPDGGPQDPENRPGEGGPQQGNKIYFDFVPGTGCIEAILPNDWNLPGGALSMFLRAYCPARSPDVTIPGVPVGGTAQQCAQTICDAINAAYIQAGIPQMNCTIYFNGTNWVIQVCYTDCLIDGPTWGAGGSNPSYICPL